VQKIKEILGKLKLPYAQEKNTIVLGKYFLRKEPTGYYGIFYNTKPGQDDFCVMSWEEKSVARTFAEYYYEDLLNEHC
jgi:hypothetical protein